VTTLLQPVHQGPEGVGGLQQHVHVLAAQDDGVVSRPVHQAFRRVRQTLDVIQFQERRQPLQGVAGAEHQVDGLLVGGIDLQLQERLLDVVDVVAALGDEIHDEGGVVGEIRGGCGIVRRRGWKLRRRRAEHRLAIFRGNAPACVGIQRPEPFPDQVLESQEALRTQLFFLQRRLHLVEKAGPLPQVQDAEFAFERVEIPLHEFVADRGTLLALEDGDLEFLQFRALPTREPFQEVHFLGIGCAGCRCLHGFDLRLLFHLRRFFHRTFEFGQALDQLGDLLLRTPDPRGHSSRHAGKPAGKGSHGSGNATPLA
jgi:hypothetical protein